MDRDGLADFLRRRRAALRPEDVGLPVGRRRRTRGLRREEVAARAHISTDFYTRLEQRRGARPSASTVASLAVALRLDEIERDHLFALAGHNAPPTSMRSDEPSPGLLRVLEQLDGSPAMIEKVRDVARGRAQVVLVEERGAGPARNGAVAHATGEVLVPLT